MQKKRPLITSREIGKRIKKRRKDLKISQEKLAEALGVTYQQVQRYESGTNKLNVENIQVIADVLAMPASYFFETGGPAVVAERTEPYLSQEETLLFKHFKKTRDRNAKNIVLQVAKLAAKLKDGR